MFGAQNQIDPSKVAVYIRWSTDEQGHGTTLEVQKEACQYYCRSQGWAFREDLVFVDEGYSGGTLDRPALTGLREAVKAGQIACVVVYKLDRLSRNLLDCVTLVRQEWAHRCALYSTKENFDTNSPVGQMVFNILVSFAEFERNVIRDRTLSGKRKRAEQGRNAGQRYPYGYKKGDNGEWALDGWDEETQCPTGSAAIVRRIFDDYLTGSSATTIADRLRREGVPAPMGGEWRFGAITRILGNPCYAGQYVYGRRNEMGKKAGEPAYKVDGAIPPIVTLKEFERVQAMRRERAGKAPRSLASEYLLSGLIKCGKCGHPVNGSMGSTKRYYVCTNRNVLKGCDCGYIDADRLESVFLQEVKKMISLDNMQWHVQRLEGELQQRLAERTHAVREAEEGLATAERKRRRLDDEFFAGNLDGKAYGRLLDNVAAERLQSQERLDRAREALREVGATTVDMNQLMQIASRLDVWAELSTEELKQVLGDVTASVTVYQEKASITSKRGNPNPLDIEWRPKLDVSRHKTS